MNIIFCKSSILQSFNENKNNDETIISKFYKEKRGLQPELYNFDDYNGNCYGYVSIKDGKINLSKIEFKNSDEVLIENALVVWVRYDENIKSYVIIGWYKNSKVYKYLQREISYPTIGRDLYFNFKASSKDCILLPLNDRNFKVNIEFKNETNVYFLKNKSDFDLKDKVLKFINSYNGNFINFVIDNKIKNEIFENSVNNPISLAKRGFISLHNEGNYYDALKFFNTALIYKDKLNKSQIIEIEYAKGLCFQFLNAFSFAKSQFEKIIDLGENNIQIKKNLLYLYIVTKNYNKALNFCDDVINNEKTLKENVSLLTEFKCIKLDILIKSCKIENVKKIAEEIIYTSEDELLKAYCKKILDKIKYI